MQEPTGVGLTSLKKVHLEASVWGQEGEECKC